MGGKVEMLRSMVHLTHASFVGFLLFTALFTAPHCRPFSNLPLALARALLPLHDLRIENGFLVSC